MTNRLMRWFDSGHLAGPNRKIVDKCRELAEAMDEQLEEGPEKTTGLRKLLEAKDCFVRANIEGDQTSYPSETRSSTARWTPPPNTVITG